MIMYKCHIYREREKTSIGTHFSRFENVLLRSIKEGFIVSQ